MLDDQGEEILPKFSVAEIAKWRGLISSALLVYEGVIVQAQHLVNISRSLTQIITGRPLVEKCDLKLIGSADHIYEAVYETILAHMGAMTVNLDTAKSVSKIIAGNIHMLRAGQDIPVWRYQTEEEWVLVKTLDTYGTITPQKQIHGHTLVLEVLTGRAAGRTIHQFATDGMLNRMARKLGIRNMRNRRPVHARELAMTYMYVKLKVGEKLESSEYRERSSLNSRNRSRAIQRDQYKDICLIGSKWPCIFCRMGYADCQLATHPETYVRGTCRNGHSGWVREESREPICMACQQRQWIRKHGGSYVKDEESSSVCGQSSTVG